MIRIIADSTCDIAPEEKKDLSLITLPLTISVEGENKLDGVEISLEEIYHIMEQGILPKTSQIPYEVMEQTFRQQLEAGMDVIYVAFSSEMSGCYNLACMLMKELSKEYPERNMEVIDSKGGSYATGLIVLQALKMAQGDFSFEEISKEIHFMIEKVEHIFSVADLNWMVKGGRISRPLGFVGNILGIRPWMDVEKGKMVVKGLARGERKAMDILATEVMGRAKAFPKQLIAITHADDLEAAKKMEERIRENLPEAEITITPIGGVLGVHLGMGGVGIFFFREPSPHYCLIH